MNRTHKSPSSAPLARLATAAAICILVAPAAGEDRLVGPIPAEVLRPIDGDTFEVKARVWLGLDVTTKIRIRGIDAPELHGRCQKEKDMAATAAARLATLVGAGDVALTNIGDDKYFGRVIADVTTAAGKDLGAEMLASGLARPYDGGSRGEWCGVASLDPSR